jgi:SAM-dependent methyltransferase
MFPGFFEGTEMPDPGWWETLWPEPGKVLAALGVTSGMDVIDLCCGDGLFTATLAKMARHVFAIDIDPKLLDVARARLAKAGVENCTFIEGDAYHVADMVARPVGFVLLANAFHGVSDQLRLSRAISSILEPDGKFAIVNWHRRPREETTILGQPRGPRTELRMTPSEVAEAVEPIGWKQSQVVEIPPYHYGAIFTKLAT